MQGDWRVWETPAALSARPQAGALPRQVFDMCEWLSEQMSPRVGAPAQKSPHCPGTPALWGPSRDMKWVSEACDHGLPAEPEGPGLCLPLRNAVASWWPSQLFGGQSGSLPSRASPSSCRSHGHVRGPY